MAKKVYESLGSATIKVRFYAKVGSAASFFEELDKSYKALLEALENVGAVIDEGFDDGIPYTNREFSIVSDSRGYPYDDDGDSTDG